MELVVNVIRMKVEDKEKQNVLIIQDVITSQIKDVDIAIEIIRKKSNKKV